MINRGVVNMDSAGRIRMVLNGLVAVYIGGTPLSASGELVVTDSAPVTFIGGFGYDTLGRLVINPGGVPNLYNSGIGMRDTAVCVASEGTIFNYVAGFPVDVQGRLVVSGTVPVRNFNFLNDGPLPPEFNNVSGGTNGTRTDAAGIIVPAVTPRFDHGDIRTNFIRNNTATGGIPGVIGAGGVNATNWFVFLGALTGLTVTLGFGTENGIAYQQARVQGTPSAAGNITFGYNAIPHIAAVTGQTWTTSLYLKLHSGNWNGVTQHLISTDEYTAAGVFVVSGTTNISTPTGADLIAQRPEATRTLSGGATVGLVTSVYRVILSGAAVDFTLRIGMPQLELGSTATAVIPTSGNVASVATPKGLLIEEQRTNAFPNSAALDNASWIKLNATITPNVLTSPSGALDADKLVEDATNNQHRITRTTSGTTNTNPYAVSGFGNFAERTKIYIGMAESPTFSRQGNAVFDLALGLVSSSSTGSGGASGGGATIQNARTGWRRCAYTLTLGGADTALFVDFDLHNGTSINYLGDGVSGEYAWGAQLEAGNGPTSYIPTLGAAVTRAKDDIISSGAAFSSWYGSPTELSLYAEFDLEFFAVATLNSGVVELDDGTFNNAILLRVSDIGGYAAVIRIAGVAYTVSLAGATVGPVLRMAISLVPGRLIMAANGVLSNIAAPPSIPVVNRMILGEIALSQKLNGHLRVLQPFATALPDSELVRLTTPPVVLGGFADGFDGGFA